MADSLRKMEEIEAQRIIAQQKRQIQQNVTKDNQEVSEDTGLLRAPKVFIGESMEEKVLKKSQVCFIHLGLFFMLGKLAISFTG